MDEAAALHQDGFKWHLIYLGTLPLSCGLGLLVLRVVRASMPPYAITPEYGIKKPICLYIPSPIVDSHGFMREYIKHRAARIVDLSQATGIIPSQEEKWINYFNVVNSIKPWRAAGKPFVCDRLWLWTS